MSRRKRQLHLAFSIQGSGYHTAAWRHPACPENPDSNIDFYVQLAQMAERAKFDMVFFADWLAIRENLTPGKGGNRVSGVGRLEPITALAALSAHTSHIGLTGTISTSFIEPYHVARIIASLDHVSKGRAGWNVVTSWSNEEARNFNEPQLHDRHKRYERAWEFLKVVFGLWDGWDEDAFVRDRETGIYFDFDKMRRLNHVGDHFRVQGPLNMEPAPQGRPIISQAGASEEGQELAAATADMIFSLPGTLEKEREYYESVKGRMAKYGRNRDDLKIMPAFKPIVGETESDARARVDELMELISPEQGKASLSSLLGDVSHLDINKPLPNPPLPGPNLSTFENRLREHALSGKTVKQLYQMMGRNSVGPVGTAAEIADFMEHKLVEEVADGFNCLFSYVPEGAELFIREVVPLIQKRGIFRTEYEGRTLRDHLGLTRPAIQSEGLALHSLSALMPVGES